MFDPLKILDTQNFIFQKGIKVWDDFIFSWKAQPDLNFYLLFAQCNIWLFWSQSQPVVSDPPHSGHSSWGNWIVLHAKMPEFTMSHEFLAQQLDTPVANCYRLPWDRPLIYLLWGTCWLSGQSVCGGTNTSGSWCFLLECLFHFQYSGVQWVLLITFLRLHGSLSQTGVF